MSSMRSGWHSKASLVAWGPLHQEETSLVAALLFGKLRYRAHAG